MRVCCVLLSAAVMALAGPTAVLAQWESRQSQIQWPDPPPGTPQQAPRTETTIPKSQPLPRPTPQDIEELTPSQIQRAQEPERTPSPKRNAAPAEAKPKPKSGGAARMVACSGAFAKNSNHLRLAQSFGSQNLTFAEVDGPDSTKLMASILFPRDPRQRLEVLWENEGARSDTQLIVINGRSSWSAPRGLRLGSDLAAIERANGKPFKLSGFSSDGATVTDWQGGSLASLPGGCKINIRLVLDQRVAAEAREQVMSAKEHLSNDAKLRAARPAAAEILVGY